MNIAARAIIIENGRLLVMKRNKYGSEYFTLVGGKLTEHETPEQGLVREVFEETGLHVTSAQLVYLEEHRAPYNSQYIFLCTVAPHADVTIQESSEEGRMNVYDMNTHHPFWISSTAFAHLPFRTPQLQEAIVKALKKGFPKKPVKL